MSAKDQSFSQAKLRILLALAGGEMHGYKIIKEVAQMSDGQFTLGAGTLYDNLAKLMDQGWVEDLGHREGDDDPRRRYYKLSTTGRRAVSAEVARLEALVVKARFTLGKPARGK